MGSAVFSFRLHFRWVVDSIFSPSSCTPFMNPLPYESEGLSQPLPLMIPVAVSFGDKGFIKGVLLPPSVLRTPAFGFFYEAEGDKGRGSFPFQGSLGREA